MTASTPVRTSPRVEEHDGIRYESLGPDAFVHRPSATGPPPADAPSFVLVFGWMDAKLRHVSKYAGPYAQLYPHATIVVHMSNGPQAFFVSDEERHKSTEPIASLLRDGGGPARSMLFHCFSNGGLSLQMSLMQQMNADKSTAYPAPLANIMDCSPGIVDANTANAFVVGNASDNSLSARARRLVYMVLVRAFFAYEGLRERILRTPLGLNRMREFFNSPASWSWAGRPTRGIPPRLYLYSETDYFIPPRTVEAHAEEAQKVVGAAELPHHEMEEHGAPHEWPPLSVAPVRRCHWTTQPHCSLARKNPKVYWDVVRGFATEAQGMRQVGAKL